MRTEPLVELLVATLAGEVQVEVAERRREGVRVVQGVARAVGVADLELVAQGQLGAGHLALEDARRVAAGELDRGLALGAHDDPLGRRPERAHRHPIGRGVGAEHAVGVAEAQLDEGRDVLVDGG